MSNNNNHLITLPLVVLIIYFLSSYRFCWLLAGKKPEKPVWHIPIAVYTVLDSWWWTENLSETCRVLFQK